MQASFQMARQKGRTMIGVSRVVRALFGGTGKDKLTGMSTTRGRRMARRIVGFAALLLFAGLALGYYGRFIAEGSPLPVGPQHVDTGNPLSTEEMFEQLAKTDPVAMYDQCLTRYQRETTGSFTATLIKKERVEGHPKPPENPQEEVIHLFVRGDVPDKKTGKLTVEVLMKWQSGAHKDPLGAEIRGALYSEKPGNEGTHGKIVTWRPKAWVTTMKVFPTDPLAQSQSRYCILDAGMYRGMLRTYEAWKQRQEAGTLKTKYEEKRAIPELDGRVCHIIDRLCDSPEADAFLLKTPPEVVTDPKIIARDGFTRVRVMIDVETWQQVGTELYRPDGNLLASYYFRNANNKATLDADTFTTAGLEKK